MDKGKCWNKSATAFRLHTTATETKNTQLYDVIFLNTFSKKRESTDVMCLRLPVELCHKHYEADILNGNSNVVAPPQTYNHHTYKCLIILSPAPAPVKYTSISIAHFYAKRLKCAQTWITQFYLQITPCLPLLPSRRTSSPPFGWYSFYRPTEGRRLSRPGWFEICKEKFEDF